MRLPGHHPHYERVRLFGLPLDIRADERSVLDRFRSGHGLLTYLNPLAWRVAQGDANYVAKLDRFDFVVCDGIGVQSAVKAVFGVKTPIMTPDFSGIAHAYLGLAAQNGYSLCLVGSKPETLKNVAKVLQEQYPAISHLDAYSGYGEDPAEAKRAILENSIDMVLVGMGMGRQESYLLDLVDSGWRGIGICVGGFFDKLADPALDYPEWSKRIGLRFLGRLVKEPRRLSRRYFVEYQPFMKQYIRHIIHGKQQ